MDLCPIFIKELCLFQMSKCTYNEHHLLIFLGRFCQLYERRNWGQIGWQMYALFALPRTQILNCWTLESVHKWVAYTTKDKRWLCSEVLCYQLNRKTVKPQVNTTSDIYEQMTTKRIKIQSSLCEWERGTRIYMFTEACVETKGQNWEILFLISLHI